MGCLHMPASMSDKLHQRLRLTYKPTNKGKI